MRSASHRDIVFLDLIVGAEPVAAPRRSLEDLLHRLAELHRTGEAFQWRSNRRRKIMVRRIDLRPDEGIACLLLYATNRDGPGASFTDVDTDEQRNVAKLDNEGRPDSAHLLLAYRQNPSRPHRYLALLEESATINRACVETLFNHLLRAAAKLSSTEFRFETLDGAKDARGRPKTKVYKSIVELQGHPSSDFLKAIEGGVIRGMVLETGSATRHGFGESPYVAATKTQVRLSPATTWKDVGIAAVRHILGTARQSNYEAVRIAFQTDENVPRSVVLDTTTGNVLGDGFVKKKRVGPLQAILNEASTEIEAQLTAAMNGLLEDHQAGEGRAAA